MLRVSHTQSYVDCYAPVGSYDQQKSIQAWMNRLGLASQASAKACSDYSDSVFALSPSHVSGYTYRQNKLTLK